MVWGGSNEPTGLVLVIALLVATIQRLPQSTIESTLPNPGTASPRVTFKMPWGPSKTAAPPTTSRTVQPGTVVGRVSGVGVALDQVASCSEPSLRAEELVSCLCEGNGAKK